MRGEEERTKRRERRKEKEDGRKERRDFVAVQSFITFSMSNLFLYCQGFEWEKFLLLIAWRERERAHGLASGNTLQVISQIPDVRVWGGVHSLGLNLLEMM